MKMGREFRNVGTENSDAGESPPQKEYNKHILEFFLFGWF